MNLQGFYIGSLGFNPNLIQAKNYPMNITKDYATLIVGTFIQKFH